MDHSSPETMAQLLHLSKDGRAATLETTQTVEECMQVGEIINSLIVGGEDTEAYIEELASLYLPSLVRSLLALGSYSRSQHSQVYITYSNVVTLVAMHSTCSLPRFVRELPDEASDLFLNVANTFAGMVDNIDLLTSNASPIAALLTPFLCLYKALVDQLPQTSPVPSLPQRSRQTLQALAFQIHNRQHPELAEDMALSSGLPVDAISRILRGVSEENAIWTRNRRDASVSWWGCEHGVAADREGTPEKSKCVKLPEGEEMMACSRCLAVRYCSKEHQKVDWKRHKRLCFKPTW